MQHMFQSATFKLTAWYLLILMVISITFSVVIYTLNYREVSTRLENLQHSLIDEAFLYSPSGRYPSEGPGSALSRQSEQAATQMLGSLIYVNFIVLIAGGLGSYFLARLTLRPIADAHEAQSRFTSDASHELRTPLAAMKAELEVTLRDPKLKMTEARQIFESNLEEVNKLISLSEMLLSLSRLDHDTLEREAVDIVDTTKNVIDSQNEADIQRFDLTSRKLALVKANEPAIRELITILVDNALKYSPTDSKISVRIFEQRGMVGFEISNSGEPIPANKLPAIFDRFVRGDASRTSGRQKGYGLGLSIAKKITDIHGGTITVTSTKKSTTFIVLLPSLRKIQAQSHN